MRMRCTTIGSLAIGVALASLGAAPATAPSDPAALEARVRELEAENAQLRRQLAAAQGAVEPATYVALREQARRRMLADRSKFSVRELGEIEKLYQIANDQRGSPAARASLEKLIDRYPASNRAGCAVLYLAQWAEGEERERLFKTAIERHNDTFYGDGCQVGPYARFQLAQHYADGGSPDKAKALRDELRAKFPTAVDHGQQLLVGQLGE